MQLVINKNQTCLPFCFLLLSFLVGCGTLVGNPKKPGGGDSETNQETEIALPDFELVNPDELLAEGDGLDETSLMLTQDTSYGLLSRYTPVHGLVYRTDRNLKQTRKIIRRLSQEDQINRTGSYARKGESGNIDGEIRKLEESDEYDFQALFCVGGEKFLQIDWLESGEKTRVLRSFKQNPLQQRSNENFMTSFVIEKSENTTTFKLWSDGELRARPSVRIDGKFFSEYMEHVYNEEEKTLLIRATHDYHKGNVEPYRAEGDSYLWMKYDFGQNSGRYFGYNKGFPLRCDENPFEETPFTYEGALVKAEAGDFCYGREIGQTRDYSASQRREAFEQEDLVEVLRAQNILDLDFTTEMNCPTN